MSLPTKLFLSKSPIYDDTDDDLSDISERSREEDTSEPTLQKRSPFIDPKFAVDRKNGSPSGSAQTGKSGFFTPDTAGDSAHQNPSSGESDTGNPDVPSTVRNADQQVNTSGSTIRPIVQARRLERSESDDTTSATDSLPMKQSIPDTFYSPDESVDDGNDTDDQKSDLSEKNTPQTNNQTISALPQSLNMPQTQKPTNNNDENVDDEEEDDDSGSETSSTGSQHLPLPTGKMALGEPQSYTARFYTV